MEGLFKPGDLVRQFVTLHRWQLAERVILLEGEHDQRYFALAARLYSERTSLSLLGPRLAAFPTGIGDEGGAYGLQRHFHPLRAIMDCDVDAEGHKVFHAVALFDDDYAGRRGFAALTGQHLNYRQWRDVFLLKRSISRSTREPSQLTKLIDKDNLAWRGLDCEIEDLVDLGLIQAFVREHSRCVVADPDVRDGGIHCRFTSDGKTQFIRFVESNAGFADVQRIVEILKSLRYLVGLPPDGDVTS
jgi:hypothetical protein